jgi:hypothetical protein
MKYDKHLHFESQITGPTTGGFRGKFSPEGRQSSEVRDQKSSTDGKLVSCLPDLLITVGILFLILIIAVPVFLLLVLIGVIGLVILDAQGEL